MRAHLRVRGKDCNASILDASSRGLSMSAERVPPRGEIVEVVLARSVLVGQVRWTRADQFGVILQDRIDVAALRQGQVAPQAGTRASAARAGNASGSHQKFALHDVLFLAACALGGVVFLVQAFRTWI
ncbi:MAG: hypothetical protein KGM49_11115 [Sphingomonadales bacterium]|nr:hypothetical protein [Sphingomonadales bacterium]